MMTITRQSNMKHPGISSAMYTYRAYSLMGVKESQMAGKKEPMTSHTYRLLY